MCDTLRSSIRNKYRFLPESKGCTAESLARARSARARDGGCTSRRWGSGTALSHALTHQDKKWKLHDMTGTGYHMHLNSEPAFSCSRTHWNVFERKILATSNEKVGMYREKTALEELIVSGICCWRLRLLGRFFRSDQLLSLFVDSELQRSLLFREQLGFILTSTGRHIEI